MAGVEAGVLHFLLVVPFVWTLILLVSQIHLVVFKKVDVSQEYPGGKQDRD